MLTAFTIAHNDLACYAKNRMAIFWTFLGPAICMWFFGFLTPSSSGLEPVTVMHRGSKSTLAAALSVALRRNGHFVSESSQLNRGSGLTVEVGDSTPGAPYPPIVLHTDANETAAERSLRYEIAAILAASSAPAGASVVSVAVPALPNQLSGGFQRTVPAYLIMFLTMNLLMSGAGFAEERASGRLRRLLTAPIAALSVVVGRLASRLIIAWLQMILLFSIGVFVLRIHWAEHPLSVVLMLSLYVLAMGSVGILIGTQFHDPDQAMAIAMWTALILAPLTGLWWPIELMPAPLQVLGHWLPTGWVMHSVSTMLTSGAGLGQFQLTVAGLLGVATLGIWISARRLAQPVRS